MIPSPAQFIEVFVPLFVALSPITVLPVFLTMTHDMLVPDMRRLGRRAVVTAATVAISIVLFGPLVFRFLGITVDDLRVAGGIILLVISVHDLLFTREKRKTAEIGTDAGVVPLGIPLIVGPATMTTSVVLADSHGEGIVITGLVIILAMTAVMLHFANQISRVIPAGVSRAFGKVMSLFLAAIAVSMLRSGIFAFINTL